MKFYIADAFTEEVFGGNPAGVVLLDEGSDFPDDERMRQTAAELRYSETAFIKKLSPNEFQLRYFTPAAEVDLCGHATIATFSVLLKTGAIEDNQEYVNHTLAGNLTIKVQHGFVMMEMAKPEFIQKIESEEALDRLYSVMGLSYEPLAAQYDCSQYVRLLPLILSTGLPDIIMPVKDRAALEAIQPDFPALSALSEQYRVTGVHAFTLDREDYGVTAYCRNFAPLYDIDEEAATGTSNGALTYYLFTHQLIPDGKECTFIQGEAMGRPSKIHSHIRRDGEEIQVQVGGNAVILAQGEIFI